jgi:hypothetical protein
MLVWLAHPKIDAWSCIFQLVQQRLRMFEVVRIEALGESAVARGKQLPRGIAVERGQYELIFPL